MMSLNSILISRKEKIVQKFFNIDYEGQLNFVGAYKNIEKIGTEIYNQIDFIILEINVKSFDDSLTQLRNLRKITSKPIIGYSKKGFDIFADKIVYNYLALGINKPLKKKDLKCLRFIINKHLTNLTFAEESNLFSNFFIDLNELIHLESYDESSIEVPKLNQILRIIIENAGVWISVLDNNRNVLIWNKAAELITGYSKEEVIGNEKITRLLYPDENYQKNIQQKIKELGNQNIQSSIEIEIYTKDKKKKIINFFNRPILSRTKQKIGNICIAYDITPRKQYESDLLKQIKENQVLVKEINHRVKNNLQLINSLLNLQAGTSNDNVFKELIRETQNRVRTVALIIEELYHAKTFSEINVSDLISKLVEDLVRTFDTKSSGISIKLDLDDVIIPIDDTISIGLLVNEIISNSFKYAFINRMQGKILIKVFKRNQNAILIIADDGEGMHNQTPIENAETLGLQLISTLAEQLNAKLQVNVNNGVEYQIEFPIKKM